VRVTARLVRASDGGAAWSGTFDSENGNVFDVQDEISTRVAEALAASLSSAVGSSAPVVEVGGTRSPEAYQLYLAAAWRSQDMRSDSSDKSIALIEQAIAIDPGYAQAWALLAWLHRRRLWRVDALPSEVFEAAGKAVRRSLALAPALAQGHAGLGFSMQMYEFDFPGAEREYRRALVLNANESSAHFGLALVSMIVGRTSQGFEQMRVARELDPMSPVFHAVEASLLVEHGRLTEARARLGRAFDIAPSHGLAWLSLGLLEMAEKRNDQATAALVRAVEMHDAATRPMAVLAMHYAALGDARGAREILEQLRVRALSRYVPPTSLATACAAVGDTAAALDAIEEGYRVRDVRMMWLKDDPAFASLRGHSRYAAILKRMKLDGYGPGLSPL
jgi:Flp pilus assembly protein TadD